jgi:hypothetical protein
MSDCVNTESFKETEIGPVPVDWEAVQLVPAEASVALDRLLEVLDFGGKQDG